MDPYQWFTTEHPLDAEWIKRVAGRRLDLAAEEREDLANRIASAVAKACFGG